MVMMMMTLARHLLEEGKMDRQHFETPHLCNDSCLYLFRKSKKKRKKSDESLLFHMYTYVVFKHSHIYCW
jgi:hypothetical protein